MGQYMNPELISTYIPKKENEKKITTGPVRLHRIELLEIYGKINLNKEILKRPRIKGENTDGPFLS